MKTKQNIINSILEESKIHHNISISFSKVPSYDEKIGFDVLEEGRQMASDFADNWLYEKTNDSGNRNVCGCNKVICTKEDFRTDNGYNGRKYFDKYSRWLNYKEAKALKQIDRRTSADAGFTTGGACKKHDLWHVYTAGRSGATLYWDKYWKESNMRGVYFVQDEAELTERGISELRKILAEMLYFKNAVAELMKDFYSQCKFRIKELEEEKTQEEKHEALYQRTLKTCKKNQFIKRLITDII